MVSYVFDVFGREYQLGRNEWTRKHGAKSMIGHFETDQYGMPVFQYEDHLPYKRMLSNGEAVRLPEDPWFYVGELPNDIIHACQRRI